eukprot:TRINITY_DN3373_c0_g1_i1.p1 TRINITY_DN3373_c0_g1~~TRINITY_DN3373_c0_g1_i1.p1  ORF type:complete len:231 (-),score=21.66 TRINITY_DN3373_c0_g1_i1:64-756(-)
MVATSIITQAKKENYVVNRPSLFSLLYCCFVVPESVIDLPCPKLESRIKSPLLPPPSTNCKKTLVLDLDETLIHSSFKEIQNSDIFISIEVDTCQYNIHVLKRPHVDLFLKCVSEWYEVVVFTASLSKYADAVLDKLDVNKVVTHRLFRESCVNHMDNYIKDLGLLGRDLNGVIIIDNSPVSYMSQPENAVPVKSWFDDKEDSELLELIPLLESLSRADDVRKEIAKYQK